MIIWRVSRSIVRIADIVPGYFCIWGVLRERRHPNETTVPKESVLMVIGQIVLVLEAERLITIERREIPLLIRMCVAYEADVIESV